jgi:nitrous oxide reductase
MGVYGLPSGRMLKQVPVFSQDAETGYGYSEETKPMLMTSHGFTPWDDSHHPQLSRTDGQDDGRWIFVNANNTPRIARTDLGIFKTVEIISSCLIVVEITHLLLLLKIRSMWLVLLVSLFHTIKMEMQRLLNTKTNSKALFLYKS